LFSVLLRSLLLYYQSCDARLFSKNKQANLKNKPKMENLMEKQAQRAFGRKIKKVKPAG